MDGVGYCVLHMDVWKDGEAVGLGTEVLFGLWRLLGGGREG